MFQFEAKQAVYNIAGVKIGGQHGELPTVLMASIFYQGDHNVINQDKGIFNRQAARACIDDVQKIANLTGVPVMLDLLGASQEAIINYIDFAAEETDLPFLIDGTTEAVRLAGARHVVERGLQERAVYDSVSQTTREREMDELKELGLRTTVIIVLNHRKPTVEGRLEVVEELIDKAHRCGFEQLLLDTAMQYGVKPVNNNHPLFTMFQT